MYVWLSQNRYSSIITPSFQCPMVHIGNLNDLPVGWINIPPAIGIGLLNVPSIMPVTAVHSPVLLPKTDGMLLDPCVGSIYKHGFQIFNMPFNSGREMSVRPVHPDVFWMTLMQPYPGLVAEYGIVKRIKGCKVPWKHFIAGSHLFDLVPEW